MTFQELAEIICRTTKLDIETILAKKGCTIHIEAKLDISLEWQEEKAMLNLYANIKEFTEKEQEKIYPFLLRTHLFGAQTQDAVFGVQKNSHTITLFKTLSLTHLHQEDCLSAISQFTQQALFWQTQLHTHLAAS